MTDPRLEPVAAFLAERTPVDARERASIRRFDAELRRLARPFDAAAGSTHITASAVVLGRRGVLLHRHKRLGLWLQPGGHIDGDERPVGAALRELEEETGLVGDGGELVHVDVHGGGRGHVHLDLRFLVRAEGDPAPGEGESPEVRWFSWDDALAVADPGLAGILGWLRPSRAGAPGAGGRAEPGAASRRAGLTF